MFRYFKGVDDASNIIQYPLRELKSGDNGTAVLGLSPSLPDDCTNTRQIIPPVLVNRQPGIGDRIFALAAAYAYHKKHPYHQISFLGDDEDAEWLSWIPWLEQDCIKDTNTIVQLNHTPISGGDRAQIMGKMMGVDVKSICLDINVPKDAGPIIDEDYIVFVPFARNRGPRSIPPDIVANVLCRIPYKTVMIDHDRFSCSGNNVINMSGELRLAEVFGVIDRARGVVCVDTGLAWVSAALEKPTLCMFGHVGARERAQCTKHFIGVDSCSQCAPCGDLLNITPKCRFRSRIPKCMQYYSSNNILIFFDTLIDYIERRGL